MHIMYVDESGTISDKTEDYYILTGVIVNMEDVVTMKKLLNEFKWDNFTGDITDAEIHMHPMFRCRDEFATIKYEDMVSIIDALFKTIKNMPIKIITVILYKKQLKENYSNMNKQNIVWEHMIERFEMYLKEISSSERGSIKVDYPNNKNGVYQIITNIIKDGTMMAAKISHIENDIFFVNSRSAEGIQIADVISYCINKQIRGKERFLNYKNSIIEKFFNIDGITDGIGICEIKECGDAPRICTDYIP